MLPLMRRVRLLSLSLCLTVSAALTACTPAAAPLYCMAEQGQVWGVAPLPAGAQPECPDSDTVRAEVRSGQTRVEQFALPADQAETVLKLMQGAGYAVVSRKPDDGIQLEAILKKGDDQVMYFAEHQPGRTFVTLTGFGHGD